MSRRSRDSGRAGEMRVRVRTSSGRAAATFTATAPPMRVADQVDRAAAAALDQRDHGLGERADRVAAVGAGRGVTEAGQVDRLAGQPGRSRSIRSVQLRDEPASPCTHSAGSRRSGSPGDAADVDLVAAERELLSAASPGWARRPAPAAAVTRRPCGGRVACWPLPGWPRPGWPRPGWLSCWPGARAGLAAALGRLGGGLAAFALHRGRRWPAGSRSGRRAGSWARASSVPAGRTTSLPSTLAWTTASSASR